MGWTYYHAKHYYKNGRINRKAECDNCFTKGFYEVVKSTMVGTTYYAAIRHLKRHAKDLNGNEFIEAIPKEEQEVFGVVFLTSVAMKEYNNFGYKNMSESVGPVQFDCPDAILDLLSPTESEWANNWRQRCRKQNKQKRVLKTLPIGAEISIEKNGTKRILKKSLIGNCSTPAWIEWSTRTRYKTDNICKYGFEVL